MTVKREEAEMAGRASDDLALSFTDDYDESLHILPSADLQSPFVRDGSPREYSSTHSVDCRVS